MPGSARRTAGVACGMARDIGRQLLVAARSLMLWCYHERSRSPDPLFCSLPRLGVSYVDLADQDDSWICLLAAKHAQVQLDCMRRGEIQKVSLPWDSTFLTGFMNPFNLVAMSLNEAGMNR